MPELGVRLVLIALGVTFTWAALAKTLMWARWRSTLTSYGWSGPVGSILAPTVPLAEASVPILILLGAARASGAVALVLLAGFSAAILRARRFGGNRLACGCFGRTKERDYRGLLARNGLLALAASIAVTADQELISARSLATPTSGDLLPVALILIGIAAIVALFAVAARHL